jgi:quercetin dioxygenase-like cupin family protein
MKTINLNQLELNEFVGVGDPKQRCKATFPLLGTDGANKLAAVYVELEQGDCLGKHTDSAEELLIVLEGNVLIGVGNKSTSVKAGQLVLVPEMETHDIRNTGAGKAKVLGVFGGVNQIVATFENAWMPTNSNIVDTAKL